MGNCKSSLQLQGPNHDHQDADENDFELAVRISKALPQLLQEDQLNDDLDVKSLRESCHKLLHDPAVNSWQDLGTTASMIRHKFENVKRRALASSSSSSPSASSRASTKTATHRGLHDDRRRTVKMTTETNQWSSDGNATTTAITTTTRADTTPTTSAISTRGNRGLRCYDNRNTTRTPTTTMVTEPHQGSGEEFLVGVGVGALIVGGAVVLGGLALAAAADAESQPDNGTRRRRSRRYN